MAGVSAGEALLFQYTGMFCGNCGNRILCSVVCCLAESAVERIYDIPGIGIYNTIYDIMIGDAAAAMSSGLETFKAVAAIVLGIVCVFVIPNKWFRSLW